MTQADTRKENEKQVNLYGISTLSELAEILDFPIRSLIEATKKGTEVTTFRERQRSD